MSTFIFLTAASPTITTNNENNGSNINAMDGGRRKTTYTKDNSRSRSRSPSKKRRKHHKRSRSRSSSYDRSKSRGSSGKKHGRTSRSRSRSYSPRRSSKKSHKWVLLYHNFCRSGYFFHNWNDMYLTEPFDILLYDFDWAYELHLSLSSFSRHPPPQLERALHSSFSFSGTRWEHLETDTETEGMAVPSPTTDTHPQKSGVETEATEIITDVDLKYIISFLFLRKKNKLFVQSLDFFYLASDRSQCFTLAGALSNVCSR